MICSRCKVTEMTPTFLSMACERCDYGGKDDREIETKELNFGYQWVKIDVVQLHESKGNLEGILCRLVKDVIRLRGLQRPWPAYKAYLLHAEKPILWSGDYSSDKWHVFSSRARSLDFAVTNPCWIAKEIAL